MHVNVGGMCQFHTAGPENEPAIKEEGSQVPSSSASRELADYSQVDILDLLYRSVNFGAGKSPRLLDWWWGGASRQH